MNIDFFSNAESVRNTKTAKLFFIQEIMFESGFNFYDTLLTFV